MKVTLKLVILFIIILAACNQQPPVDQLRIQTSMDSIASLQIDSAYKVIQAECDTAKKYRLPLLVDSLLKLDSLK